MGNPEDAWKASFGAVTATSTGPSAGIKTVNLYHELGPQPEDSTIEEQIEIGPVWAPSVVRVKSHVLTGAAKALRSPQYLATIRRRSAEKTAKLIDALASRAQSEDFVVATHEPLEELRRLIHKLTEAEEFADPEHEGNSCEILRQLRDTLLNTGWERYREPAVREAAVSILQRLATADEVSADDAYRAMDQLLELNLNPAAGTLFAHGEEEEVPD